MYSVRHFTCQKHGFWKHRSYTTNKDNTNLLIEYINKPLSPINLKKLNAYRTQPSEKTILVSAQWLHNEIPIRVAGQVDKIDHFPHSLDKVYTHHDMPSVQKVRIWYKDTFERLIYSPLPNTIKLAEDFGYLLDELFCIQDSTLITMAQGVIELKKESLKIKRDISEYKDLRSHLDQFYTRRIGISLLVGNFLDMLSPNSRRIAGLVVRQMSPVNIARAAIEDATEVCMHNYAICPSVQIFCRDDIKFPYIPGHLYYVLVELLKNSMRAVSDFNANSPSLPPIKLFIADRENKDDPVSIKLSDEGGGIKNSVIRKIWDYGFSTAQVDDQQLPWTDHGPGVPLAGYGHGLPLANLYASYFGGKLQLFTMPGYGTDFHIVIPTLGNIDECIS